MIKKFWHKIIITKKFLAIVLIFSWIFSGWPQINGFPLQVKLAYATTCANDGSVTNFVVSGTECIGYITTTGSGTFTLPSDWSSTNTIEVIGGGGGGGLAVTGGKPSTRSGGGGGGGGAYSKSTNVSVSNGASYSIGTAGTDTWFNSSSCNASSICAKGGSNASGPTNGTGGAAGSGFGTIKNSGGNGGSAGTGGNTGSAGGGGSAGGTSDGNVGTNATTSDTAGGTGDAGSGGTAGTAGGGTGGNGFEWVTLSKGSGGGGGGNTGGTGGAGGNYGGGAGGGLTAGSGIQGIIVITYTPITPTFNQSAYRLFNNIDSTDVGTTLALQDTAGTLGSTGAAFRLRSLLYIGTTQLGVSAQNFKLQFSQQSGTCDTGFVGETYADVTANTVIAYNNNPTPSDGATLTANASDPTHSTDTIVNQTYEELNNFTNSVAAIPSGQDGKWDFSLKDNGAPANTAYCLRVVKSDGSLLNTYTVIPQITTAPAAIVSISISNGTVTYGTIPANTSKSTCTSELNDAQTITNDGNVAENFNIRGQNSTNWTLGSTTASDQYVHKFLNGACSTFTGGTALTTTDQALATGIIVNGTSTLNLQITTPSISTTFTQQSVNATITAIQQ